MRAFAICISEVILFVTSVVTPALAADLVSVSAHTTYTTANPGGAYELDVFLVVPPNASLGTAQFVCDVTAQSLAPRNLRENETQVATFEVVR